LPQAEAFQTRVIQVIPRRATSVNRWLQGGPRELQAAGFGFGEKGAGPGRFYDFDRVSQRSPTPNQVNQLSVD
jgi:hypothetical protein